MFNGLTVLSLVLCVATMVLWVRSHWQIDELTRDGACWSGVSYSDRGVLLFGVTPQDAVPGAHIWGYVGVPVSTAVDGPILGYGTPHWLARLGIAFEYLPEDPAAHRNTGYYLYLPHYLFCVMFLLLPAAWYRRWKLAKRRGHAGRCAKCGYDLRATPDRRPECGTVIQKVVQAE
jgi:4-amino-4-deoxy-L-arabinose transferase-like glycosyltransferase